MSGPLRLCPAEGAWGWWRLGLAASVRGCCLGVDGFGRAADAQLLQHVLEGFAGEELDFLHLDGVGGCLFEGFCHLGGEDGLERAEGAHLYAVADCHVVGHAVNEGVDDGFGLCRVHAAGGGAFGDELVGGDGWVGELYELEYLWFVVAVVECYLCFTILESHSC